MQDIASHRVEMLRKWSIHRIGGRPIDTIQSVESPVTQLTLGAARSLRAIRLACGLVLVCEVPI